ncbi:hypothetical protein STCU_01888 [Strigomonas culicis]|uniref:Serine aminopeptidase S33 domain-containing protein n=1 Tax=Strigomonas culicis TaxID=28005 RepID=S9UYG0_9TRYP|nr:hypothetical protein STCU_01888 [Strigomonas culicis]|eukprot:EPY33878.1 hypothetical protein STCU_01888 [Strigomonas culicis]
MSDGQYISLGFYERQDLAAVVEYLTQSSDVDGIALWGRSMGAVSSIMYASKDDSIRCVVCDSPFGSLRWLVQDLVEQHGGKAGKYIPGIIIKSIVERIRKRIMKRAAFDIDDLNTIRYASTCQVPGLLFHGEGDDFVAPKHSQAVRDAFVGSCLHQLTPGGHNDERDEEIRDLITAFLRLYMVEKPSAAREAASQQERASVASGRSVDSVGPGVPASGVICSYESVTRKAPSTDRSRSSASPTSSARKSPAPTSAPSGGAGHRGGEAPRVVFPPLSPPSSDPGVDADGDASSLDMSIMVDVESGAQPISFRRERMLKVDCTSDLAD